MQNCKARLCSAPARPLTDSENFKKSAIYEHLNQISILTKTSQRKENYDNTLNNFYKIHSIP
jgi:hypothetical protein